MDSYTAVGIAEGFIEAEDGTGRRHGEQGPGGAMSINVDRHLCWFYVDLHGSRLEFVLHDAEDRNGHERGYYEEQLRQALGAEFKGEPDVGLQDSQAYGGLSFCIVAPDPEALKAMLHGARQL